MRSAVQKTYGALKTLTVAGSAGGPAVILFHGYGADSADLLPLSDYISLSKDVTWIFPEGPMEVIIAPGFYGKAWYAIDARRLEQALRDGEPVDLSQHNPPGLEHARQCAQSLYDAVRAQHRAVVVGGFSQGAMLSTELALTHATKPKGLVIMSGSLICEERWRKLAPSAATMPFIQSHGKNDAILGYQFAERLYAMLCEAGMSGDFVEFSGGHEIPPKVLEKIGQFLLRALK